MKKYLDLFLTMFFSLLIFYSGYRLGKFTTVEGIKKHEFSIYVKELQNIGWSKSASEHIAKVEFNLIPKDSLYTAYMED